jgi:hypothetical protein
MSDAFVTRKSVHINLMKDTHAEFRVLAFRKKLSMQAIVEGLVSRLVNGDPSLVRIVDKMAEEKKSEEFRKVVGTDADSVYDILESLDSLKED